MKKFLLIFSITTLFAVASQAQTNSVTKMKTAIASAVDSIRCDGTASNYLYVAPSLSYKCASFVSVIRRISTADGGTLTLQGSNDNTNWYTTSAGDTIHVTNGATDGATLVLPASTGLAYRSYRFKCNGLASDTMEVKVWFNGR